MRKLKANIFERSEGPLLSALTMILSLCTFLVVLWILMTVVRVLVGWPL